MLIRDRHCGDANGLVGLVRDGVVVRHEVVEERIAVGLGHHGAGSNADAEN